MAAPLPQEVKDAIEQSNRGQPVTPAVIRDMRELIAMTAAQQYEALKLYEPLPFQEQFHACRAPELILSKGNRVGGPQPIDEPVLTPDGWTKIGDLGVGDTVIGGDGRRCTVTGIQEQGWLPIFQLTFDDGATTRCAENHFWRCKLTKTERFRSHPYYKGDDYWGLYSLREIREHGGDDPAPKDRAVIPTACVEYGEFSVPIPPYTLGVLIGDGAIGHVHLGGSSTFTGADIEIAERVESELPDGMEITVNHSGYQGEAFCFRLSKAKLQTNPIARGLKQLSLAGKKSETKFIPDDYMLNSVKVRTELLQGLMDTDGYCSEESGEPQFYTCSPQLADDVVALVRSLGGKARLHWKETFITSKNKKRGSPGNRKHDSDNPDACCEEKKRCLNMAVVHITLPPDFQVFGLKRKQDRRAAFLGSVTSGRVLEKIRPCGNAPCVCIQVDSPDNTYVTKDFIVTHNSLTGFAEVARAVTCQDIYGKYPSTGTAVCLGYGEGHIGRVIHRYLFRWGAFKIIRDLETKQWRTYHPWPASSIRLGKAGDLERADEARSSPPLIPKRFIDGKIAWTKRSEYVFSYVKFVTGWEMYAFNSAGEPEHAQGFQCDLVHVDEDVAMSGWILELSNRLRDRKGKLRWTAMPHNEVDDLYMMIERAEEEEGSAAPRTVVIYASIDECPYVEDSEREEQRRIARSYGEEEYARRTDGRLIRGSALMYPSFDERTHWALPVNPPEGFEPCLVQLELMRSGGVPPNDWTRYFSFDPGWGTAAGVFIAVPPPAKFGNYAVVYDEIYIHKATASIFAKELRKHMLDQTIWEFIFDFQGGRLRGIASGELPLETYEREFKANGLSCVMRQNHFTPGCDVIEARELAMREALEVRSSGSRLEVGYPKLLIVMEKCPNLVREIKAFKRKKVRDAAGRQQMLDTGNRRNKPVHALESCEMAIGNNIQWHEARPGAMLPGGIDLVRKMHADFHNRIDSASMMSGGGGINLGARGSSYT